MKKILLLSTFVLASASLFAQSVTIYPDTLRLPSVTALPGCTVTDYGKVVFLTTTNRANICSGSGWIEIAPVGGGGSLTLPYSGNGSFSATGFSVQNTSTGAGVVAIEGSNASPAANSAGVRALATSSSPTGFNYALYAENFSNNANGYGVYGKHNGGGYGVTGQSVSGYGIFGFGTGGGSVGVFGSSNQISTTGVYGNVTGGSSTGVLGRASQSTSVAGFFENTSATGLAIQTIGKLRFQGNGAAINKVLISADASGNATWETLTRSDILKLGPAAFQSHISANESTMGSQGISMTSATGSFHANVALPHGATITSVKIFYIDNDGTAPANGLGLTSYALQKMVIAGAGTYTNVTGANGSFTNASASTNILNVATAPLTEVVDNITTFYRLVVAMPSSTNLVLVGAAINYTYDLNN